LSNWTGNPPLSRHWPGSALGALAMLVLNAAFFLKMLFSRSARECHAEPAPQDLPDAKRGTHNKEPPQAAAAIDSRRAITHRAFPTPASPHPPHESCSGLTRASLGGEGIAHQRPFRPPHPTCRLLSKQMAARLQRGGHASRVRRF